MPETPEIAEISEEDIYNEFFTLVQLVIEHKDMKTVAEVIPPELANLVACAANAAGTYAFFRQQHITHLLEHQAEQEPQIGADSFIPDGKGE